MIFSRYQGYWIILCQGMLLIAMYAPIRSYQVLQYSKADAERWVQKHHSSAKAAHCFENNIIAEYSFFTHSLFNAGFQAEYEKNMRVILYCNWFSNH